MSQISFNNYDSQQYQLLMANFQHLIDTTQDRLNQQKQGLRTQHIEQAQFPRNSASTSRKQSPIDSPTKETLSKNYAQSLIQSRMRQEPEESFMNVRGKHSFSPSKYNQMLQPSYQCSCGLEDTVKSQQKEIQELKIRLELMKPIDIEKINLAADKRPTVHEEYLQDLLQELKFKDEQLIEFNVQLQKVMQQLDAEQTNHRQTQLKSNQLQQNFEAIREELHIIEAREFQISDKLTKEYSDLVIENIQLKETHEQMLQQVNKYSIALNQLQLNIRQETFKNRMNTSSQTDDILIKGTKSSKQNEESFSNDNRRANKSESFNQSFLNTSLLKDSNEEQFKGKNMRQVLREKIEKAQNNTDKFILLYVEQKKLKNRSQNEVKFYTELGKMLERIKENYNQLQEAFTNYTMEQDQKEEHMKRLFEQTLESVRQLKENASTEIEQLQIQLSMKDEQSQEQQKQVFQLTEQNQTMRKQNADQQQQFSGLNREKKQLVEKIENMQTELSERNQDYLDLQNMMETARTNLENQVKHLRNECNELKKTNLKLDNELGQCRFQMEQQEISIQGLNQHNEELQLDLDEKQQKLKMTSDQLRSKLLENQTLKDQLEHIGQELSILDQQDQRLSQANYDLLKEKQQLHESVEKGQSQQMELFEKHAQLERQFGKLQEENNYLREQLLQYEDSLSGKDQENGLLQAELNNIHNRLDALNYEKDQFQEQLMRSQDEKNRINQMLKSNEQSLKEKSSEFDRQLGDTSYKSQRIVQLEKELQNQSQTNMELQSVVQATEQELRMLQDYHDQTLNNMERLKVQLANLTQLVKDKENAIKGFEIQFNNLEIKADKERAGLHADYQQKYGMFQSKIMIQEEEIKDLQQSLRELEKQTKFQKSAQEKGGNWEELLETSYYYNKQSQIKIKVLTSETQRLNAVIENLQDKVKDLEAFIEKMIEYSEENRLLAKQILVEQYEKGQSSGNQISQNLSEQLQRSKLEYDQTQQDQFYNSAETFGQNENSQPDLFDYKTPSTKKGRL